MLANVGSIPRASRQIETRATKESRGGAETPAPDGTKRLWQVNERLHQTVGLGKPTASCPGGLNSQNAAPRRSMNALLQERGQNQPRAQQSTTG